MSQDKFSDTKKWFSSLFELYESSLNGHRSLLSHQLRKGAIERLDSVDFPTRKDEDWKYTSVKKLLSYKWREPEAVEVDFKQIEGFTFPELKTHRLTFVNGHLDESLSETREMPAGVTVTTVDQALEDDELRPIVERHFKALAKGSDSAFLALNAAFSRSGVFIHVPDGVIVDRPVHLLNLAVSGKEDMMISPQLFVVVGKSSELTIIESYRHLPGGKGTYFTNAVNRVVVKANGRLSQLKLQDEDRRAFQINNTEAFQDRDSTFTAFTGDLGGQQVRNNLSAFHQGENILTNLYGIYMADGKQHIDNQTFIDHALPHCNSNELYKGIITDRGKGVFNGKVMVRQDAQKTNAFQQNSTLVLSENGTMDTKPQLEIFADDVRCSHGATIGQLDEKSVFYLRTRGLTDAQARRLLQKAFIKEVLDFIEIEGFRAEIDRLIEKKF
ncbi:MAG: Fe-S cluster assembly protein SufD [Saprospiraceae bacterium]|nr:Fe-S cluster assembly protein SufD [Saprospiraceae bacterium]